MKLVLRVVALVLVVPATYYAFQWFPFSPFLWAENRWLSKIVSLLCAVGVGWFVWVKLPKLSLGIFGSTMLGAVLLGGVGFSAGFFGPIIFSPDSNQGPLLGILITGPLGFIVGGVAGLVVGIVRERAARTS